jgi:hyaluronan synthase
MPNVTAQKTFWQNQKTFISQKKYLRPLDYTVLIVTLLLMVGGIYAAYILQPSFEILRLERMDTWWGKLLISKTIVLLLLKLCFLGFIAFLYFRYRSIKSVSDEELPTVTVIVPAFNEGRLVYDTLISLANSDYPAHKMELIALDDGSKDDTWMWIKRAKEKIGDMLTIYQQPTNQGKRKALYRGFNKGTGEVFVTVDSDSVVKEDTLRNLVSPFVVNKNCGAVAGNVQVLNNNSGMIPRMLNVSFVFSFEFIRSAQSVLGSVLCTPGALAAYRRNAVMNCLDEWINQTFMGKPSDIGEDRAMTNMILKQGYHVNFQRNAYVLTNTPVTYKSLYKMFIRWERSNVRENIMMSKFAFDNFRIGNKTGTRILLINQWLRVLLAYPVMLMMIAFIVTQPMLFFSGALTSIFIFSSIQVFFHFKRKKNILDSIWAYPYSIFYLFMLFWITPYAIATVQRRGWLTR